MVNKYIRIMKDFLNRKSLVIIIGLIMIIQGCDGTNSSNSYHNNSRSYSKSIQPSYPQSNSLSNEQIQELLKQLESTPMPRQRQRIQRSEDWERGYNYGWDTGYEDAVNGNGAWSNYDDSGKGGDFLDGYESGYIDGYESGRDDRDEDDEDIEEL